MKLPARCIHGLVIAFAGLLATTLSPARVEAQSLPVVHFEPQGDESASRLDSEPMTGHKFWDGPNRWLFGFEAGALVADGWTTNYALHHDFGSAVKMEEGDPLAKWFVSRGWGGQILLGTLTAGGGLALSHVLHTHGHHLLERTVPVVLMSICGVAAVHNGVLIHHGLQAAPFVR
jgi:hypothetical protein